MDETLFYVFGIALVVFALVVSFAGLRAKALPAGPLFAVATAVFAVLVGATTTFAVRYSEDEEAHRAEEAAHAAEQAGQGGEDATGGAGGGEAGGGEPAPAAGGEAPAAKPAGPGGTLQLAADPVQLRFDKQQLSSKPGEVTIEFTNPAQIEHDVAILEGEQELAKSDLIAQGETSVSTELAPGSYSFICTVPGHAEAGMEGTLTVK
jgi:plastocyanin